LSCKQKSYVECYFFIIAAGRRVSRGASSKAKKFSCSSRSYGPRRNNFHLQFSQNIPRSLIIVYYTAVRGKFNTFYINIRIPTLIPSYRDIIIIIIIIIILCFAFRIDWCHRYLNSFREDNRIWYIII